MAQSLSSSKVEQLRHIMCAPKMNPRVCESGLQGFLNRLVCVKADDRVVHFRYCGQGAKRLLVALGRRKQELSNGRISHAQ
jgi:hypothetical protein